MSHAAYSRCAATTCFISIRRSTTRSTTTRLTTRCIDCRCCNRRSSSTRGSVWRTRHSSVCRMLLWTDCLSTCRRDECMTYETTLHYDEALLREAAFGFWRRTMGGGMVITPVLLGVLLTWILKQDVASWIAG